ncbi:uncharacterized protein B0I36DRAFT_28625 [Microdochium trichocladiopsis]|uniref:XRCC4 coiled-coil domain-containing protein n=1 Tax=Microdochium trichocladiopsis TaxID=1682393 RepID=A0A9P8XW73_9PEZI|nr:uncharacterized protein B0I36DRAFT_28625 [Microdochium trichocladiopsis]KAH7021067.1 hypothetical protein B0I36DRAFT_28625 [Microdochium trichocladiopsis]
MPKSTVLRFPITAREDEFFLLEVSPHGSKPLDLKLLGTEGEGVYLTRLRHRRIAEYKSATGHCTDAEWENILTATLIERKSIADIEIRADVLEDGAAIGLSFRKNIQGIKQRLGSLKLPARPENDSDVSNEISPFHWCVSILGEQAELQERAATSSAKIESWEHVVDELKDQLQELIKAKEDDETQLLEKFRDLLNEKKVKIRQQQRLLATANLNVEALAEVEQSGRRKPGISRSSKRKGSTEAGVNSDDEPDHDADLMEIDDKGSPQLDPEPDERVTTDDETEDEATTQSEEERNQKKPNVPKEKHRSGRTATRTKSSAVASEQNTAPEASSTRQVKAEPLSQQADDAPPAKRELPFMRNKKKAALPPKPAAEVDDDETGSEDEL